VAPLAAATEDMMKVRRIGTLTAIVYAFLIAHAFGQYAPSEVASRDVQARVLAIGEQVKAEHPTAWRNAHNAGEPQGSEFVRRWAIKLKAAGILACVNGKRGGDTLSQDVLDFPVTSGGAQDTSGRYPRIVIADVIAGAGGSNPSLTFGDVSEFAPGKCIEPKLEAGESGGGTPPPVDPGPVTPPVVTPPPTETGPILAELRALRAAVDELRARPDYTDDLALVRQYLDDMIGAGPGDDPRVPNHITDIKQREDRNLEQILQRLDQLSAWLRSRRALGF
jgi:hypothetical protein